MRIIVPTIQHTGSFFVVYHLLRGRLNGGQQPIGYKVPGDGVVFHHTYDHFMDGLRRELRQNKGVAPLRHPKEVWASWERRGKDRADLFDQTRNMLKLQCPNLQFLPIDSPDRELYINRLSDHLAIRLHTHWPTIHQYEGPTHQPKDEASYSDYIAEFGDFFSRYYCQDL